MKSEKDHPFLLHFRAAHVALPPQCDLKGLVLSVEDQGHCGTCVCNAGAKALQMVAVREGDARAALPSRRFAYFFSICKDNGGSIPHSDPGTFPRTFLDVTSTLGAPPETSWPYLTDQDDSDDAFRVAALNERPTFSALSSASDARSPFNYQRIEAGTPNTALAFRTAIAAQSPVMLGLQVGQEFEDESFDPHVALEPPDTSLGGHCIVGCGYELTPQGDYRYLILNSWGPSFGNGGYAWLSERYLLSASDAWAISVGPTYLKGLVP